MTGAPVDSVPKPAGDINLHSLVIATVCMLGGMFGPILAIMAMSQLMLPMTTEFGWTRTEFSLATTLVTWSGALISPFIGRAIDRVGVKPLVMGGTVLSGLTMMAMSRLGGSLFVFCAAYAFLGFCGASSLGYVKVIASLFTKNRGKMLAVFGLESTIALAAMPLLINFLVGGFGWRMLYVVLGAMVLCLLPLQLFLLEEPGRALARSRGETNAQSDHLRPASTTPGLTLREIIRTRPFWIMMTVSMLGSGASQGMMLHMFPFLISKGFVRTIAASYLSVSILTGIFGTLLAGWLMDKIPTAKIASPFYYCNAIGGFCLVAVTAAFGGLPLLYLGATITGISITALGPMNTYFHTRFFGLKAFVEVAGLERALLALVGGATAPLLGWIYDATHNYAIAFSILAIIALCNATLFLFMPRYRYAADVGLASPEPDPTGVAPLTQTAVAAAE